MAVTDILLLLGAGLAAGYVAGLIGVGGGIIFAPVLLFYFDATGVAHEVIPSLTIGSSLFCTLVAAVSSAWFQYKRGAVDRRIALVVGLSSAAAVFLMTRFVTTQPWYTKSVFQGIFSVLLLLVVVRMVRKSKARGRDESSGASSPRTGWPVLAGVGSVAGTVASAVGVGGGVVLVPAYNNLLRLPIHRAVGTSSATIVLISLIGVLTYATTGLHAATPATAVGYVDFGHALLLAVPSVITARLGVWTAHRINTRALRLSFAVLAAIVAVRLLVDAL